MTNSIDRLSAALLLLLSAGDDAGPALYVAIIVLGAGFVADILTRRRRDDAAVEAVRRASELPQAETPQDTALQDAVKRAGLKGDMWTNSPPPQRTRPPRS